MFVGHEVSDVLWEGRSWPAQPSGAQGQGCSSRLVQPPPLPVERAEWEAAMLGVSPLGAASQLEPDRALLESIVRLARERYSRVEYNQKR